MKKLLLFIAIAFIGIKANAQAVAEYNFDNTMNNVLGNSPFTINVGTSFTTDRFNVANSALNLGSITTGGKGGDPIQTPGSTTATITNLPIGNSARSISIWVKSNMTANNNPIFSYGNSSANAAFGLGKYITTTSSGGVKPTITTTTNLLLYGYGNDLAWAEPSISANWNHFVVTYTGSVASIYMNGVLQASGTKAWNTASTVFRLGMDTSGTTTFFGAIDDLKIYDRVITTAEISNLYTNNSLATPPIISAISENATSASASTINYTLNAKDLATTSVINYGTSTGNLTMQANGGNASGGLDTPVSGVLTGLTIGSTYYYQIVATNSLGSTTSTTRSFTQINPSTAIAEYNFDNSYDNIYGNTPFAASNGSITFGEDRNGNPANALRLYSGAEAYASIANLPVGNSARAVSIWIKQPTTASDKHIFKYGSLYTNNVYGLSNQSASLVNFGFANDLSVANQAATGANWVHVVTTFDGVTARIYRNGTQIASGNKASWNTLAGSFILGGTTGEMYIDDLKIYNRAISVTEVSNLYTSNSILATTSFHSNNLKATIYPNPAKDILNIQIENEIKSVEIYSLLGQKVLSITSKTVNISGLSKGIYMIRIEDMNNEISTQKLIIE